MSRHFTIFVILIFIVGLANAQYSSIIPLSLSIDKNQNWQLNDADPTIGASLTQTADIVELKLAKLPADNGALVRGFALIKSGNWVETKIYTDHEFKSSEYLKIDPHLSEGDRHTSEIHYLAPTTQAITLRWKTEELARSGERQINLKLFFSCPTASPKEGNTIHASPEDEFCPQPDFKDRIGWCPDGTCPKDATPAPNTVTHIIVHHSAGGNFAPDWDAVVRIIWDLHVNGNGWDDIGYNWLIAPDGNIYEGRGDAARGAHFCGKNTGTLGICMLGTYIDTVPPDTAIGSLMLLLAAKAEKFALRPLGIGFHNSSNANLPRISGHRDGCATVCPGDSLYARLPAIRSDVHDYTEDNCPILVSTSAPSPAESLTVYPNPASDNFTLKMDNGYRGALQIQLYNTSGQLIMSKKGNKSAPTFYQHFDTNGLNAGFYLLRIQTQQGLEYSTVFIR